MIDVLIITHNEALNLPHCLASVQEWTSNIFVVDSGSTDETAQIARDAGAHVVEHKWEGYAAQRNWGLRTLPFESSWVLILDADEVVTDALRRQLLDVVDQPVDKAFDGYQINRLTYFLGKPIRHCGYFPTWTLRFFKRGKGQYENREVHEHLLVEGQLGKLQGPLLHQDRRGMEHFIAKHNRYSTLEARALLRESHQNESATPGLSQQTRRRRWLKVMAMHYLPIPGMWRFIYMYILQLGFLDGRAGLYFSRVISLYDSMVAIKFRCLAHGKEPVEFIGSGLSQPEGTVNDDSPQLTDSYHMQTNQKASSSSSSEPEFKIQCSPSPWSTREKLFRVLWMLVGKTLFRLTFHNWYCIRRVILRLFGAKVGSKVLLRPTANIEIPWTLHLEDNVAVGDHAILYCLGPVRVGARTVISQYAHLCAGSHEYRDPTFPLIRASIDIGHDVWICADAFIGPHVQIGSGSVIGARSSVYHNMPPMKICVGNPAKPIRDRETSVPNEEKPTTSKQSSTSPVND